MGAGGAEPPPLATPHFNHWSGRELAGLQETAEDISV